MRRFRFSSRYNVVFCIMVSLFFAHEEVIAAGQCPCDIYEKGGTPCVAAHSTTRALYASYDGPLYQVRRTSDNQLKDIPPLTPGGIANAKVQDDFLAGKPGTISIIYDQTPNGNDLIRSPVGGWLKVPSNESDAVKAKIKINGYDAYGVYTYGNGYSSDPNVVGAGYRNNNTKGVVKGNDAEGIYGVFDGKHVSWGCCFDYGNVQTNMLAKGPATMESIYFGTSTQWGHGSGNGPWVMNDPEYGIQAGYDPNEDLGVYMGNTSIIANYVMGVVKSDTSNLWAIRGGDATKDILKTMYRGRQAPGYFPKKLEGAIVLGLGGDNSNTGDGTFFEGAMIKGMPSDAVEDEIHKNVMAIGYGRTFTAVSYGARSEITSYPFKVSVNPSLDQAVIRYTLQNSRRVSLNIVDQRGRRVATIVNNSVPAGTHRAVWDTRRVPAGVYIWKIVFDGRDGGTGRIAIGK
jgi:hypothetical protein